MRKFLASLLCVMMVFCMMPGMAFAEEAVVGTPAGASDAQGNNFTGYTSEDRIWGEVWGNAKESFVIKILDANGNVMGTTSLINKDGIIDGDVYVTWNIKLDAASNTSEYWDMEWTTAPTIENMPAKVELWVDGTKVSGGNIVLNRPDSKNPIFAAKTDADGKILSYIACDGYNLSTANTKLQSSINDGDNVAILVAGTYAVPTGKDVTIIGAVDGVVFDNIGARNMDGANVTFNNITFDYYPNVNYTGLQHSGNLVYNDCTINGQPFLYGTSETFNNCTFNQDSSDAYNVWTYGAKEVEFNGCTFNSAGKSVLIYSEDAALVNDVTVTDCDFIASAPVEGKAAIEMDSSLIAGINLTIDNETTVTGFGTGSVSGNSLWNDKKSKDKNVTVFVDDEKVLPITKVSTKAELDAAIAAATEGDVIKLTADIDYTGTASLEIDKAITLDLGGKTLTTYGSYGGLRLKGGCSLINGKLEHKGTVAAIKAWDVTAIEDLVIDVAFKEGKTIGGIVIQEGADVRIDTIKNVTIQGEGLTNGIQTYNCGNATESVIGSMENVTIDAVGTGMLISAPCGTATNCSITGGESGIEIWIKGTYSAILDLVDCDVTGGEQAVYAHDEFSSNPDIVNNGELKLTADEGSTFASESGAMLTLTIARAENVEMSDLTERFSAKVGDKYYETLIEDSAYVQDDGSESWINIEIFNPAASENVKLVLYSGTTPLTTSTLNKEIKATELTGKVGIKDTSSSWTWTAWTPKDNVKPDKLEVYIDDVKVGEASVEYKVMGMTNPEPLTDALWAGVTGTEAPSPSYSGGGYVSIEKPEITADAGADYNLSILGTTLTITAKDGYELVDVTLNGVSKGAVTELKGLKTSDKVVIVTKAIGSEEPVADEAQLVARSQMSKAKGKKAIKVYWFNEDGSELTYDGYEIFRSTKRFKGYGTKPIFETEREAYWNTDIELGTKYYYKVRGYNVVDGEKEYSEWSLKAWRVAE